MEVRQLYGPFLWALPMGRMHLGVGRASSDSIGVASPTSRGEWEEAPVLMRRLSYAAIGVRPSRRALQVRALS